MITEKKGLATYSDVMDHLKIGRTLLYTLVKSGELKVVYVGSAPRIEWSEVERYIATRRQS